MIKKGSYVEIEKIVLDCEDRSKAIPYDTKKTPLKMWARGFCDRDCKVGDIVTITTVIGRELEGRVTCAEPSYDHGYGKYVEELAYIGVQAKKMIFK